MHSITPHWGQSPVAGVVALGQHRTYLMSTAQRFFGLAQFGARGDKNLGHR